MSVLGEPWAPQQVSPAVSTERNQHSSAAAAAANTAPRNVFDLRGTVISYIIKIKSCPVVLSIAHSKAKQSINNPSDGCECLAQIPYTQ